MLDQWLRALRPLLFPFLVMHAIFPAMWLITVLHSGPVPNDWLLLKTAADHFVAGDWSGLYGMGKEALRPGYYWLCPPFALYVVAPLAWLPEVWAYALLTRCAWREPSDLGRAGGVPAATTQTVLPFPHTCLVHSTC